MSTIKTSNLQNGSSSSVNIALNTDGSATFAQMPVGPSYFAMRNKIINGAMEIDQRNSGASVNLSASSQYVIDRWYGIEDTDGTMTAARSSIAPNGFINSLLFTTGTADSSLAATQYCIAAQVIEGLNVADLAWGSSAAKTITFSFWVRSSLTGTFGGAINNSGSTRSYPFTYSISVANSWEYKTVVVPGDVSGTWLTTNGVGVLLCFGLGAGSTLSGPAGSWASANYVTATGAVPVIGTAGATWQITGVQFEIGSVATPFERRNYQQELGMCLRYYQTTYLSLSTSMLYAPTYGYVAGPMRTSPTFTATLAAGAAIGVAFYPYSNVSFRYLPTGGSGLGDYTITISAEF